MSYARRARLWFIEIGKYRFGFERSCVPIGGVPSLDRYILYVGLRTLRLHRFMRGDDDRAPHDHPWPFWTFPLKTYWETYAEGSVLMTHQVKALKWHYRPSSYRHMVHGTDAIAQKRGVRFSTPWPFWTLVVTGRYDRKWGFWPGDKTFVPWRKWHNV